MIILHPQILHNDLFVLFITVKCISIQVMLNALQDLDPQTVRQIEEATYAKIGNVLNVATSGTADFLTEHNVPCKASWCSPVDFIQ